MRPCTVEGCERPHVARGLCKRHYQLEYRRKGLTRDLSESWRPMPLAMLPGYPRRVGRELADLAQRAEDEGMTGPQFEAEQARILEGRL